MANCAWITWDSELNRTIHCNIKVTYSIIHIEFNAHQVHCIECWYNLIILTQFLASLIKINHINLFFYKRCFISRTWLMSCTKCKTQQKLTQNRIINLHSIKTGQMDNKPDHMLLILISTKEPYWVWVMLNNLLDLYACQSQVYTVHTGITFLYGTMSDKWTSFGLECIISPVSNVMQTNLSEVTTGNWKAFDL